MRDAMVLTDFSWRFRKRPYKSVRQIVVQRVRLGVGTFDKSIDRWIVEFRPFGLDERPYPHFGYRRATNKTNAIVEYAFERGLMIFTEEVVQDNLATESTQWLPPNGQQP